MSGEAVAAVWKANCDPLDKIILLALADLTLPSPGSMMGNCSVSRIAKMTGMSVRFVDRKMREMAGCGWLSLTVDCVDQYSFTINPCVGS